MGKQSTARCNGTQRCRVAGGMTKGSDHLWRASRAVRGRTLSKAGLCAGFLIATLSLTAYAASDAIKKRQDILSAFGEAVKEPGAMLRNESAFDLKVVQASLKTMVEGTPKLKELFPDDSKSGAYTEALPSIWGHKDHFMKLFDDMHAAAVAAHAAVKDEATFRSEWGKVSASCRTCHKSYRKLPKS